MNKIFTFFIGIILFALVSQVKVEAQCSSWIPRDSVFGDSAFSYVHFVTDSTGPNPVAPYYRNDDGVTAAMLLPFHFCFWGRLIDTVYINNNGNISFSQQYSSFLPDPRDSFPLPKFEMIAPFWSDVYTRFPATPGSNVVIYKIQPHYMIVQWDSVAYYSGESTKFNSFQVIISDGTDPIIPAGNNVSFAYRQMQWTTGDASAGVGGFGGDPANVGGNEGDDSRYIRIGLFASPGNSYFGQFPPGPNYDEVGWLDNRSFLFNLCSGSIGPLVSGISPCDTFKICEGDSISIPLYYFSVIQGDSVWSNLAPPVLPGVSITSNYPGPTDSLIVRIIGSGANAGYHTINVYGYDNAHPSDTTYTSFVVEIDTAPRIHAMAVRDTICPGDTSVLSASGGTIYNWSTGGTTSTVKVAPLTTQSYTVSVSNGGCAKDTTITVIVLPLPVPAITAIPADSTCQGDTINLNASGGTFYIWSTGKTTTTIKVAPNITETYTLYASNGICSDSTTQLIKIIPKITATINAVDDTVCPHGATTITAMPSGGPATYKWNTGATTSSITVHDTVTTTYTAMVYGRCDSVKETMTVTVIPLPKPAITGSPVKCKGSKDTLTITSSVNPTNYKWSNGSTSTTYYTGLINADSTIYVTAENSLGCSVTDSFRITERAYPTAILKYPSGCGATTITASAFGTGPFTYNWSTGGTYDTINVNVVDSSTFSVVISNGCPITKTVTLIPVAPTLSVCCNANLTFQNDTLTPPYATITAAGNSTVYTWTPSVNCLNPPLCDSVQASPTVTTTYTVLGTDASGCQSQQFITVTVETPCFNFTVPNVFTPTNGGTLGLDKSFYIKTEDLTSWSILIYDRWGKEMFKSTDQNDYWTGNTENGGQAPAGVYYYIITGTCQNNTYKKNGFVQLIR